MRVNWDTLKQSLRHFMHKNESTLLGFLISTIAYFLLSYYLSPAPATPASTYVFISIVLLHITNAVIFVHLITTQRILKQFKWRFMLIGALSIALIFFHIDYIWHRFAIYTEQGLFGSHKIIKEWIVYVQLATLFLLIRLGTSLRYRVTKPFSLWDLSSLLLCLPPLLNYYSNNVSYFNTVTTIEFFAFLISLPALSIILSNLFSRLSHIDFNFSPIIALSSWLIYSRPSLVAAFKLSIENSVWLQLAFFCLASVLVAIIHYKRLQSLTILASILITASVFQVRIQSISNSKSDLAQPNKQNQASIINRLSAIPSFKSKPDVYFLVYDSYVHENQLSQYGIKNSDQIAFLKSLGFTIYPNTYAAFPATLGSISRVLDMSLNPQEPIAGNNLVNATFQREGYKTNLVLSSYFFENMKDKPAYDFVYPKPQQRSGLDSIYFGIRAGEFKPQFVFEDTDYFSFTSKKREIFKGNTSSPKFLYTHSRYPGHSQNSGRCLPNETSLYAKRLELANKEMRTDISDILESNRDSVIIIAGDHGPSLTGDCYALADRPSSEVTSFDILDRYGVFLAIRWPQGITSRSEPRFLPNIFFEITDSLSDGQYPTRLSESTYGFGPTIPEKNPIESSKITFGANRGEKLYSKLTTIHPD